MAEPDRGHGGEPVAAPAHFLVVEAAYYRDVSEMLASGARASLEAAGATFDIVRVHGALEIPIAIRMGLDAGAVRGRPYAGAIGLGCVIRGETYHFEIVAGESARGLMSIGLSHAFPIGNGILTVENEDQARVRADPERGNKGGEAARAMLALWALARGQEITP